MKPNNPIVNNFINRKFDILICLNLERSIPLQYVSSLAHASFKIGRFDKSDYTIYDFMIKTEGQTSLKQMIDQVNHYLNLIKNEKYEKA